MIIYNQTIFGTILENGIPYVGDVLLLLWNSDYSQSYSKTYSTTDGTYQFNLGDSDLFGPDHDYTGHETVLVQTNPLTYSNRVPLTTERCIEHSFDTSEWVQNNNDPDAQAEQKVITADALLITESEQKVYSYFDVKLNDSIVHYDHGNFTRFYPEVDGTYTITQRGVNITTGVYSEKISTVDLSDGLVTLDSLDYIFYTKRGYMLQAELPTFVMDTLILDSGWYFESYKLIGKKNILGDIEMPYSKGKVIIKSQVGDIMDY